MTVLIGILIAFAFFVVILLASAIRILREYERGVVFRLGRLLPVKGPGLVVLVPLADRPWCACNCGRSPSPCRRRS